MSFVILTAYHVHWRKIGRDILDPYLGGKDVFFARSYVRIGARKRLCISACELRSDLNQEMDGQLQRKAY